MTLSVIYADCHLCGVSHKSSLCWVSLCWMLLCWVSWRQPKTSFIKNNIVAYALGGVCYAPNWTSPLLAACKVLLCAIQILVNYARCQCCSLHDTNASCCQWCRLYVIRSKFTFYETTKIAAGIIHHYSLWIILGFCSFYEVDHQNLMNSPMDFEVNLLVELTVISSQQAWF